MAILLERRREIAQRHVMHHHRHGGARGDGVGDWVLAQIAVDLIERLVAKNKRPAGLKVGCIDQQMRAIGAQVGEGERFAIAIEQVALEAVGEQVGSIPIGEREDDRIPRQQRVDEHVGRERVRHLPLHVARVPIGAVEAVIRRRQRAAADGGDVINLLQDAEPFELKHACRGVVGRARPAAGESEANKIAVVVSIRRGRRRGGGFVHAHAARVGDIRR